MHGWPLPPDSWHDQAMAIAMPAKPAVSILRKPGFKLKGNACIRKPVITVPCAGNERRANGKCTQIIIDCHKVFKQVRQNCARKPPVLGKTVLKLNREAKSTALYGRALRPNGGRKCAIR
jgi:hypothetical protein